MDSALVKQHATWCKDLQEAVSADSEGHVLEAVEAYERYDCSRLHRGHIDSLTRSVSGSIGSDRLAEELRYALKQSHELSSEQEVRGSSHLAHYEPRGCGVGLGCFLIRSYLWFSSASLKKPPSPPHFVRNPSFRSKAKAILALLTTWYTF
jgi:hypothetical protein